MDVKITPSALSGTFKAPPSKSFAHRYLIAGFLSGRKTLIKNVGCSRDVKATLNALKSMGLQFLGEDDVEISDVNFPKNKVEINCGESGSTIRFLLPVACALGIKCVFTGSERLLKRPNEKLINLLNEHGADISGYDVGGKIKSGLYKIDASVSSQYITGLLFALPLLKGDSEIVLQNSVVSANYIDITLQVLSEFGIKIEKTEKGFFVKGNQKYISPESVFVEGDFSAISFMLTAGALGKGVTATGINVNSLQGDKKFIGLLKKTGAKVEEKENSVTVKRGELNAFTFDATSCPDIIQIASVLASFCKGKSIIKGVERLKIKESDRLKGIVDFLSVSGTKTEVYGDELAVFGGTPHGGKFCGDNDHRTVMSEATLSSFATSNSVILGANAVEKSYPDFFKDFISLGGKVDVVI